jgi:hypothetical protein
LTNNSQPPNQKKNTKQYMEDDIACADYDGSEGSLHFDPAPTWSQDVEAMRKFRTTASGSVYNYRNKGPHGPGPNAHSQRIAGTTDAQGPGRF